MKDVSNAYGRSSSAAVLLDPLHLSRLSRISRAGLRLSDHRLLLRLGDATVAVAAVVAGLYLWSRDDGVAFTLAFVRTHALWFAAVCPWLLLLLPSYHVSVVFSRKRSAAGILKAAAIGLAIYPVMYFVAPRQLLPRLIVVYFVGIAALLTIAWRVLYIRVITREENRVRVAIVGTGAPARIVLRALQKVARHMVVLAFVDEDATRAGPEIDGVPVVAGPEGLRALVTDNGVSEIVLANEGTLASTLLRALVQCQESGAEVVRMSTVYERLRQRIPIKALESDWVFTSLVDSMRLQDTSRLAKRMVDVVGGLLGSLLFVAVFPFIGPAIWISAGRPILYFQARIGRNNKPFRLVKFRTMIEDAERDGPRWAGVRDGRITGVGRFLRRSRLDEIPQFLNVLKGDMSLVGPRPERPEFVAELEQIIPFYRTRLLVRPGLTGWAQVNYRYGDSVKDSAVKLEYDLYYIKHQSLVFDALIALRTVKTVLTFSGR